MLEQGGNPSVSDTADSLAELNAMWDAWGIDEGLIQAVLSAQYALTQNVGTYSVGPGAAAPFNLASTPTRIYNAVFVAAAGQRTTLEIVPQERYFAHKDLAAAAAAPEEFYFDYQVDPVTGRGTLYMWPVPNVAGAKLELQTAAPFAIWTLAGNYKIPQGYQDAIQHCLAFRLLPRFGVAVAPEVAAVITALAQKGEARLRESNQKDRQLKPGEAAAPGQTQQQAAAK